MESYVLRENIKHYIFKPIFSPCGCTVNARSPVLCTLSTHVIYGHTISHHLHADDGHLCVSLESSDCCGFEPFAIMMDFHSIMNISELIDAD